MAKSDSKKAGSLAARPDPFVSFWSRAYQAIAPYVTRAMLVIVAGLVIAVGAWGTSLWLEGRKEKATEQLGEAVKIAEAELLPKDGKDAKDPKAQPGEEDTDVPRYKTAAERAEAALKSLDELDKKYGSTPAAMRGLLVRAGLLFDLHRYADAEAKYREFIGKGPAEDSLRALAQEGLGMCAEERGDLNAALGGFVAQAGSPFYRERALWNQARIYAKQGNKQKATEIYKDLLAKASPQSTLRDDIQNRLAALEP